MLHDAPVRLGDLWVWSTVDRKWTELLSVVAPSARSYHVMASVGHMLWMHGGGYTDPNTGIAGSFEGETHEREHIPSGLCAVLSLCVLSVEYFLTPCRL